MKKSSSGIGIGAIVAACLSWSANHSFWWAVFHAWCGWLYVVCYAFKLVDTAK